MSCHGYCGILNHSQLTSSSEQGEKREEEGRKKVLWRFRVINSLYRASDIFVVILWKGHVHDELGFILPLAQEVRLFPRKCLLFTKKRANLTRKWQWM